MFFRFIAKQLHHPSGLVGKQILPRIWNRRNSALNNLACNQLSLRSEDWLIEIGMGGGYLLDRASEVITQGLMAGVDRSPEMISFCRKRFQPILTSGRMTLTCSKGEMLPFQSDFFAKACTVNTLFYFTDSFSVISELWRVLKEGGILVVCFTQRSCIENRSFVDDQFMFYSEEDVMGLMSSAGFQSIQSIPGSDIYRNFICITGRKE